MTATSFCLNHEVNAALFPKYNLNVSCATNQIASAEEIENRGLEDFFLVWLYAAILRTSSPTLHTQLHCWFPPLTDQTKQ